MICILCFAQITASFANPLDGTVTSGSAVITNSGKKTDIYQSSQRAVIDWRKFDIAADEHTQFHQPSASSMTLNRINDGNPSQILGKLTANGNIVILNGSGVLFGAGAQVDVGGIVATTSGISNEKFMAGGPLHFNQSGKTDAAIINNGAITARNAGLVGLVAPQVENNGIITARLGKAQLASADEFTMDLYGDGLMSFKASDALKKQVISNKGVIDASGGTIALTAAASREVVDSLITVSGELKAPAVAQKNGRIMIFAEGSNAVAGNVATDKGQKTGGSAVIVDGTLDVSGKGAGEKGGTADILGDTVVLKQGASIDASGTKGGGTVRVGGDYQGTGTTATAKTVFVEKNTTIKADATEQGNGGRVILWADDSTHFYGDIFARGGALSGDGGFVEVSGKQYLKYKGFVDTTAAHGETGLLFLDPADIVIASGSGDSAADGTGTFMGNPSGTPGTIAGGDTGPTTIYESELEGISAATNISLAATNSITVNNLADNNLNLAQTAGRTVSFNTGSFIMQDINDTISVNGGALTFTLSGNSTLGNLATNGGLITMALTGGTTNVDGIISGTGTAITKQGAGILALNGANTHTGQTWLSNGIITIGNNAAFGTGLLSFSGANGVTIQASGAAKTIANSINSSTVAAGVTFGGTVDMNFTGGITNPTGSAQMLYTVTNTGLTTFSGNFNLGTGRTLTFDGPGSVLFSGVMSGSNSQLVKNGLGTLTLSAQNTYTGLTTVNAGTLLYGTHNAISSGNLTITGGTMDIGAYSDTVGAVSFTGGTLTGTSGILTSTGNFGLTGASGTISAIIAGTTLSKSGGGTQHLTRANNLTGTITTSLGTIAIHDSGSLGTASVNFNGNGAMSFNTNAITLNNDMVIANTATITANSNVTLNGNITLSNTSTPRTLILAGASDFVINGGILDGYTTGNSLTKSGTGTVTLNGNNTYSGTTAFSAGTLILGHNNALGTSLLNSSGGAIRSDNSSRSISNNITGAAITIEGDHDITFTGNMAGLNSTRTITISNNGLTTFSGNINISLTNTARTLNIAGTGNSVFSGVIDNGGGSTSIVTVSNTGTTYLTGANTYSGITNLTGGFLKVGNDLALGGGALTFGGGTLIGDGTTRTLANALSLGTTATSNNIAGDSALIFNGNIAGTTLSRTINIDNTALTTFNGTIAITSGVGRTLTIAGSGNTAFNGVISNGPSISGLTKTGSGKMTLGATNTYTGATLVSEGTLEYGIDNAISTGTLTVSGGTLDIKNHTDTVGAITLNSGTITGTSGVLSSTGGIIAHEGTISAILGGASTLSKQSAGSLTLSGANTFNGGTTLTAGTIVIGNNAALGTGTFTLGAGIVQGAGVGSYTLGNAISLTNNATIAGDAALNFNGTMTLTSIRTMTVNNTALTTFGNINLDSPSNASPTFLGTGDILFNGPIAALNAAAQVTLGGSGTYTLMAANTFGSTLNFGAGGGTLRLGHNNALSGALFLYGGKVEAYGGDRALGGSLYLRDSAEIFGTNNISFGALYNYGDFTLTSTNSGLTSFTNASLSNNATTHTLTLAGTGNFYISGPVANGSTSVSNLVKTGSGTATLNAANIYTGSTTVTDGTLILNSGNSIADTAELILNGANAKVQLGANETIGSLSGSAGEIILGTRTLTVSQAGNTTYSGILSGTGGLTKSGAGTLTLGAENTYSGLTTINAGTLAYGTHNVLAGGNVTLAGGTMDIGAFNDTVGVVEVGSGSTLTGSSGVLSFSTLNAIVNAGTATISANLGGTGTLSKSLPGSLILSGNNTYSGATSLVGNIYVGSDSAFGSGVVSINGATVQAYNGAHSISNDTTLASNSTIGGTHNLTFTGTMTNAFGYALTSNSTGLTTLGNIRISPDGAHRNFAFAGSGNFVVDGVISNGIGGSSLSTISKSGIGTLTLNNQNTFGGLTTVSGGTLIYGTDNALGSGGITVSSGATLDIGTHSDTVGAVTLSSGTITGTSGILTSTSGYTVHAGSISANLAGNVGLQKSTNGTVTLSGTNTYTGTTTISTGTLALAGGSAIHDSSQVEVFHTDSILELQGNETIGSLNGGGASGTVNLGSYTLTTGGNNGTTTFTGAIGGTGGLTKEGSGIMTLSGNSTYSGATAINAGTLRLGAANVLSDSTAVTVALGATFNLNGQNETVSSIISNGTVTFGAATGFTTSGAQTFNGMVTSSGNLLLTSTSGGDISATNNTNNFGGQLAFSTTGDVHVVDSNALALGASSVGRLNARNLSGDLTLAGTINASANAGDSIVLRTAGLFHNNVGANALQTAGSGRWLVYSSAPSGDYNNLSYNFKQYNAVYGDTVLGSGNGFVYVYAPAISGSLVDVTKTYDGSTDVTLTADNFSATGVDGDTVALGSANTGTYNNANAGNNKTVQVTGVTISGAENNGATVYGYQLSSGTLSTSTATIDKADITVSTSNVTRDYDGSTAATGQAVLVSGTLYNNASNGNITDSLAGGTFAFLNANAGTNKTVTVDNVTVSDGNGGDNYNVTYADNTTSTIDKASISVSTSNVTRTYDGTTDAAGQAVLVGGTLYNNASNGNITDSLSGGTFAFVDGNAGGGKTVTVDNVTVNDGNGGGNYDITYVDNTTSTIGKALLTVTASAGQGKIYGTLDGALAYTYTGLVNNENSAGFTGSLSRDAGSNVGSYQINLNDLEATGNYAIGTFIDDTFSITPAALTVTANSQAKNTGAADPVLTYTYSPLVNGDDSNVFGGALTRAPGEAAGTYAILQGSLTAGANYTISYFGADLTINVGPPTPPPADTSLLPDTVAWVSQNPIGHGETGGNGEQASDTGDDDSNPVSYDKKHGTTADRLNGLLNIHPVLVKMFKL